MMNFYADAKYFEEYLSGKGVVNCNIQLMKGPSTIK